MRSASEDLSIAPATSMTLRSFLKECFLSSPANVIVTLAYLALAAFALPRLFKWLIIEASLGGTSRAACGHDGACWTFVKVYLGQFLYGRYPSDQRWRIDL